MTMKKSKKVWSLLLVLSLVIGMAAGGVQSQAYSVPSNMKWWTKDRFGMFIHFGIHITVKFRHISTCNCLHCIS